MEDPYGTYGRTLGTHACAGFPRVSPTDDLRMTQRYLGTPNKDITAKNMYNDQDKKHDLIMTSRESHQTHTRLGVHVLPSIPTSRVPSDAQFKTQRQKFESKKVFPTYYRQKNHARMMCKVRSLTVLLLALVGAAVVDGHGYMTSPRR